MNFIDEVNIHVESGKGGPGKVSFRREAMTPRGGPDGGDGGRGGRIVFRSTRGLNTLLNFRYQKKFKAPDGAPGAGANKSGAHGEDLILKVPVGTVIKDHSGRVLQDLVEETDFVICEGGLGGKGNTFYKSSVNQAPTVAQKGMPGVEMALSLELKLLADVGLIGFPNAGKSTMISRLSAAKPKIADYPFTTLVPHLGVMKLHDEKSCVVADIPGLIPGAHRGLGLGIQFLRHIQRTRVFVHLVELGPMTDRDPWEAFEQINFELAAYDRSRSGEEDLGVPLSGRPQIVVLNKIDLIDRQTLNNIRTRFAERGYETIPVSAATGEGLDQLHAALGRLLI